jgi:hypothetical protein
LVTIPGLEMNVCPNCNSSHLTNWCKLQYITELPYLVSRFYLKFEN